jgi:hypothetical protein
MLRKSRLLWLAAACAVPAACTFGADDFTLVSATGGTGAASSGGTKNGNNGGEPSNAGVSSGKGGSSTAGTTAGNVGGVGGEGASAGAAGDGAGGDGSMLPLLTCAARSTAATLFSAADLHSPADGTARTLDGFHVIPGTPTSAYAIALGTMLTGTIYGDSTIVVRRLTDSMSNAIGPLTSTTTKGLFRWGGAYATAAEVHVVGTDERGIIDVSFGVTANGQFSGAPVVTPLEVPGDCTPAGPLAGSVRDMHASYDGSLSYAVTCASPDDMKHSLFVRLPDKTIQAVPDKGEEIGKIVRQYVHSKDGTMLLATGDDFGPHVDMRFGRTGADLAKAHPFVVKNEQNLGRSVLLLPQADDSGVFLAAFLVHFDAQMTPQPPLILMGGTFRILDYPTLSDVPPALLSQTAIYDSTNADIVVPADGAVRAGGDAVLVGGNPLTNDVISAWLVDSKGQPRSNFLSVHAAVKNVLTDQPSGALIGLGMAVGWRQIEADGVTTNVMLRSVSCL